MISLWQGIFLTFLLLTFLQILPKLPIQIKMIIFIIGAGLIALIFLPFMVFRPRNYKNCNGPTWMCRHFGKVLGITVEVRGHENIRIQRGGVIIMNHQSTLDVLAIAHLWPILGKLTTVAKKELLYVPFFGLGLWLSGFLFIDRNKSSDSINSLNKQSIAIKNDNYKLLVFPEGTRNSTGQLLSFKKGSFHIAIQNQCPIQPVIISHYNFLYNKNLNFNHIIINIMPEISTINYNIININKLIDNCHKIMQNQYDKLNDEIEKNANISNQE